MSTDISETQTLDDLATKIVACFKAADEQIFEAAKLIAQARARVDAGEAGDVTWRQWAAQNLALSSARLRELLRIAQAQDPGEELARQRQANAARQAAYRKKPKPAALLRNGADEAQISTPVPAETIPAIEAPAESIGEMVTAIAPAEVSAAEAVASEESGVAGAAAIVERLREVWRERQTQTDEGIREDHTLVELLLHKAVLTRAQINLTLVHADESATPTNKIVIPFEIRVSKPCKDRIASGAIEELDNDPAQKMRSNKRKRLILAVAKARRWVEELSSGKIDSVASIAEREGASTRHIRQTIPLAFLAPEIVQAIVQDQFPSHMGVSEFIDRVSMLWKERGEALCVR